MKKFEIYRPKIDAIAGGACFLLMIGFLIFIIIKVDETSKKIKFLLFLIVLVLAAVFLLRDLIISKTIVENDVFTIITPSKTETFCLKDITKISSGAISPSRGARIPTIDIFFGEKEYRYDNRTINTDKLAAYLLKKFDSGELSLDLIPEQYFINERERELHATINIIKGYSEHKYIPKSYIQPDDE